MAAVPKRVAERLAAGLKRYQPILDSAKSRDVNESDTSMIVSDMLADVFGYDKRVRQCGVDDRCCPVPP